MTRLPARTVFLAASAIGDLLFEMGFAISSIYLVTVVKLNPLQLVLVGTALEATVFFFEVPTGVVADLYRPEHGFVPKPQADRTTRQKMSHTFITGLALVRGRSVLVTILVIGVLFGGASEAFDRLWTIHLLKNFTFPGVGHLQPVVWFGIINVGAMLLMLAATEVVRRRLDVTNPSAIARTLLGMNVVRIATVIIFGLTQGFALAMTMFWMTRIFVRMNTPLLTAWLNQGLDSSVRATVLSMRGQADALGQIAGGPVLGALATAVSIRAALVAVGLIVAPAIWLLRKTEKS